LVKTLAVASMANSLECIYENVPTLSPSKLLSQSQIRPLDFGDVVRYVVCSTE